MRGQQDDCKLKRRNILLVRECLIASNKHIETGFLRGLQKFAILKAVPSEMGDGHRFMLEQMSAELYAIFAKSSPDVLFVVRVSGGDESANFIDGKRRVVFVDFLDGAAALKIIHDGLRQYARTLHYGLTAHLARNAFGEITVVPVHRHSSLSILALSCRFPRSHPPETAANSRGRCASPDWDSIGRP